MSYEIKVIGGVVGIIVAMLVSVFALFSCAGAQAHDNSSESKFAVSNGVYSTEMPNGDVCYYFLGGQGISCVAHR